MKSDFFITIENTFPMSLTSGSNVKALEKLLVCGVTLNWGGRGLCEADVVICDVVRSLVLDNLHTRAHVALPVKEEGEAAREVLAADTRELRLRTAKPQATHERTKSVAALGTLSAAWADYTDMRATFWTPNVSTNKNDVSVSLCCDAVSFISIWNVYLLH